MVDRRHQRIQPALNSADRLFLKCVGQSHQLQHRALHHSGFDLRLVVANESGRQAEIERHFMHHAGCFQLPLHFLCGFVVGGYGGQIEPHPSRQTCADFRNAPEGRQTHQVMVLRRLLDRERSAAQRERCQQGCIHSDDLPCE